MRLAAALGGLLVAVALTSLLMAPAAFAHAARIASDPPEGAQLATSPARVTATFNEPLQTAFAAITVVGPDGNLWSTGDPGVNGAVLSTAVRPLGPVGRYTVNYRVTSADGHPITGSWWFELTTPGTGTPGTAATTPAEPDDIPVWPFVAIGAASVAVAAAFMLRSKRR